MLSDFVKALEFAIPIIEWAASNRATESELMLELSKPEYDGYTEAQKIILVQVWVDNRFDAVRKNMKLSG